MGELMMFCTSLYFHTTLEKVLGTMCAITPWLLLYRVVPTIVSYTPKPTNNPALPCISTHLWRNYLGRCVALDLGTSCTRSCTKDRGILFIWTLGRITR